MNCLLCESLDVQTFLVDSASKEYFKCSNCELIFLDPKHHLSLDEQKKRYDLHENNPHDAGYVDFLSKLTNPLKSKLKPEYKGLDFGCGPGPTISEILRYEVSSIDNYDPIYFSDKKLLSRKYDFITCTEVIEHLHNPKDEFLMMKSLLKPKNSYLAIMTEVYSDEVDFNSWWYRNDDTHICFYSVKTFEWIAKWLGYRLDIPVKNVVIYQN